MSVTATTTLVHSVKSPLLAALCSQCVAGGQRNINTFSKNSAKQITQSCKMAQSCKLVKSTMDANMCKICGCLANPRKFTNGFDPKMNSVIRSQSTSATSVSRLSSAATGVTWAQLMTEMSGDGLTASLDTTPDLKRFLSEVGTDPREARYWLKQFTNFEQQRPFAIVQVYPEVFAKKQLLGQLTSCLSFLQRNNMRPVVILGSPIVTAINFSASDLQQLKAQTVHDSTVLASLLEANRVLARPLFIGTNVLRAEKLPGDTFCGELCDVNTELIMWCLLSKHIPIIPAFGETPSGQILAVDMWSVTEKLSSALQPLKVIKVNTCGGFVDETGSVIANINLPADLHAAAEKPWCTPVLRNKMERIYGLLSVLPSESSVVITSVDKMLKELFTHRGSGTFFKITEPIYHYSSFNKVDLVRLTDLITKAFGKVLDEDYFLEIENQLHTIYLSKEYNAAAIILQDDSVGVPYLCKFAVSLKAQGEGTGEMLWETIRKDFPRLFWRSRGDNPINSWYFKKCEGSWSQQYWTVFWYGVSEHKLSCLLIDTAVKRKESLIIPTKASVTSTQQ
ncbi:N-acetylglutamate synthase, mitochondrial-like [Gigantopelta aegis]|uniref:N-acetylglutamate synthase, mitochondrial-like n=1 Tax=Gigantopelta aegis TaxID=1735272 RepID=UPI001B88E087|nr:N-acetylglutamate synthase, mitochondrial-like [Gigantopelta aegis]